MKPVLKKARPDPMFQEISLGIPGIIDQETS